MHEHMHPLPEHLLLCCIVKWVFCFYHITLTMWNRMLFEKLIGPQLVKKLPSFHGTQRLITMCTRACNLLNPVYITPSLRSISYPFIYVKVFQVVLFLQVYPPKSCINFYPISCIPHGLPILFLDLITLMIFSKEDILVQFSLVPSYVPLCSAK